MRAVRICASGAGKSRAALIQNRTASRVKTSRKFSHMTKYLLTKLGLAGWENIWLSVMVHLEPFSHPALPLVNKYTLFSIMKIHKSRLDKLETGFSCIT